MARNDQDHVPERPRAEPEIIPPGSDGGERIRMRADGGFTVHRVYVGRSSLPLILFGLVIVAALVGLGFLVLAGVLLLWLPMAIAGFLLALFFGPVRHHWRRLQDWFAGRTR